MESASSLASTGRSHRPWTESVDSDLRGHPMSAPSPRPCREFAVHSQLSVRTRQCNPKSLQIPLKRLRERQASRIRTPIREKGSDVCSHPVPIDRVRHGGREFPPSLEVVRHSAHGCVRRRDAWRNCALHHDIGVSLESILIASDSTGHSHESPDDRQHHWPAGREPEHRCARHAERDLRWLALGLGARRPNNRTLRVVISPVRTTTVSAARVTPLAASSPRASAAPVICRMPSVRRTIPHRRSDRPWFVEGEARIPKCDIGVTIFA
jgi:hypothetical protein